MLTLSNEKTHFPVFMSDKGIVYHSFVTRCKDKPKFKKLARYFQKKAIENYYYMF